MLAITPQNSCGVIDDQHWPRRDAGHQQRAHDDADHRIGGNAEAEQGNKARLRAGVVGGLRSGDAGDRALAEALGMARDLSFQHVAREARHHRAAAGKQAEKKSEDAAAHHRADRFDALGAVGKQVAQALAIVQDFAGLIIAFRHQQDFADPEQAHGDYGDAEAVAQRR